MTTTSKMLSVREAAQYLGCGTQQVNAMLADATLPFVTYGAGRKRFIPRSALEDYLQNKISAARQAMDANNTRVAFRNAVCRAVLKKGLV